MITHYDIEQRSEEWHALKWGKIGGSLASGLFIESDTLLLTLLSQHVEDFQISDNFVSFAMQQGIDKEPFAMRALADYTGIEFSECGWMQHATSKILGISPDGIDESEKISAEVKCLTAKEHLKIILDNEIPKEHLAQCLHYFTINPKLKKHYFASYRPENKLKPLFVKMISRDTLIDLGKTEKGKISENRGLGVKEYVCQVPILKTVQEWCDIALIKALEIEKQLDEMIKKLEF